MTTKKKKKKIPSMYTADHLMCRSILDMGTAQLETEMLLTFVNDW
jgi:hypothetical protein